MNIHGLDPRLLAWKRAPTFPGEKTPAWNSANAARHRVSRFAARSIWTAESSGSCRVEMRQHFWLDRQGSWPILAQLATLIFFPFARFGSGRRNGIWQGGRLRFWPKFRLCGGISTRNFIQWTLFFSKGWNFFWLWQENQIWPPWSLQIKSAKEREREPRFLSI